MSGQRVKNIYWTLVEKENGFFHLAATEQGLCYVGSLGKPYSELEEWVNRRFSGFALERDDQRLQPYKQQIEEYLSGDRTTFTMPLDLHGTPFQRSVWDALVKVPHGATCSYSELAEQLGKKSAARAVGAAVGANPVLIAIPCHRVIGKSGALTGYRGGMAMKEALLQLEKNSHENLV